MLFFSICLRFFAGDMGKCKFKGAWRDKESFRPWLKPVHNNVFETFCTVCKKNIQLGTTGVKALESHAKSNKHIHNMKAKDQTPSIAGVFRYLTSESKHNLFTLNFSVYRYTLSCKNNVTDKLGTVGYFPYQCLCV